MSYTATRFVWQQSRRRGSARLLLALADCADETGLCWPSLSTLARRTRISRLHIICLLPHPVALGELRVERRGGPRCSTRYRLPVGQGNREWRSEGVTGWHGRVVTSRQGVVTQLCPPKYQ